MLASVEQPPQPPTPGEPATITVVLADDNDRFRDGIVRALARHPGLELLAAVSDGRAAVEAAIELRPHVLVLDHRMPGLSGIQVADEVSQDERLTETRTAILTVNDHDGFSTEVAAAGATALIDKSWSRREICDAIEAAGRAGRSHLP